MRKLALDFQPRRPGLLPAILLLAGLVLGADQWFEYAQLRDESEALHQRVEQLQKRAARLEASQRGSRPENVFSADETKALRQAIGAVGVDWMALYEHVDRSVGDDIALLAIRPNASGKSVQISGEARRMDDALAFVEALHAAPLSDVVLLSHQIKQNDPQRPIVFEIAATWSSGL